MRDVTAEIVVAWEMRAAGASTRDVATRLGCSTSTAHERIKAAGAAEESTDALDRSAGRILEAVRLDRCTAALEPLLDKDPVTVVPVMLKVSAARRALLGLDMPARIAIENARASSGSPLDPGIVAAVRKAQQEAARRRAEIRGEPVPVPDDETHTSSAAPNLESGSG